MPTGVQLRDVRQQLFDAAERVLLRDGPSGADQPGRHRRGGLRQGGAAPALHRLRRLPRRARARPRRPARDAGRGAARVRRAPARVAGNLTDALTACSGRCRGDHPAHHLPGRAARPAAAGLARRRHPDPAEATTAISAYLADERELGRIAADADIDSLAALPGRWRASAVRRPRRGTPPTREAVERTVATVLSGALAQRPSVLDPLAYGTRPSRGRARGSRPGPSACGEPLPRRDRADGDEQQRDASGDVEHVVVAGGEHDRRHAEREQPREQRQARMRARRAYQAA